MVNKYKRKTGQASWDEEIMARAMREVSEDRVALKKVAQKYNIPRTTLRRHITTGSSSKILGRFRPVFTPEQEKDLLDYVFHMDQLFFGLTKEEFLKLVYQFAEANNINHPFKNESAGHDFFKGFIKRHPELTLRQPEPTSIARARGFNRPQVYRFFDLLESEIEKHHIDPTRIYNMDETGIQTSSNKPPRVLTKLGKKQVGHIASTERGRTTTVICCCNAAGSFVPPFMIYARKKKANDLLDRAPPGTQAAVSDNGWTNGPLFLEWLRFFIETVRPTAEKKVLLVLDNHESHKYLPALEFASKNHVIFVSLPPHTTHRMQPLDFCVYGPLKKYFEQAVATFQKQYVGRIINQRDVAGLFATAYLRAATTQNAVSGFEKTGLWPTNRFIFDDSEFLPATTMENPPNRDQNDNSRALSSPANQQPITNEQCTMPAVPVLPPEERSESPSVLSAAPENLTAYDDKSATPSLSSVEILTAFGERYATPPLPSGTSINQKDTVNRPLAPNLEDVPEKQLDATPPLPLVTSKKQIDAANRPCTPVPAAVPQDSQDQLLPVPLDDTVLEQSTTYKSPIALRPVPKMAPNKTTKRRKTQKAEILTSTPVKEEQRQKLAKKRKADADKDKKVLKNFNKTLKETPGTSGTSAKQKKVNTKIANTRKKTSEKKDPPAKRGKTLNKNYYCFACNEPYEDPPREDWIMCDDCKSWAHEACTFYSGIGSFYCDLCQEI